jgi:hypothetical protein
MLNLNACLTKAGIAYDTLWSEDFSDEYFLNRLGTWLNGGSCQHDHNHVHSLASVNVPGYAEKAGCEIAAGILEERPIMGIFDEGCMGMYNAIIPDELLHPMGIFKERLSQSALYAAMKRVPQQEAQAVRTWLDSKGMTFHTGSDPATELTDDQILDQCRMYVAALRIADSFGCATIGIQYQQGLKDLAPASDLVEGLLNNVDRPPVCEASGARVLYEGNALPHFNEVDECAGVDALVTNRVWRKLGLDPETTLHDVRFGAKVQDEFVWLFEISGSVPPAHFQNGYAEAVSERQPPMYFPMGGGTIKGVSKLGEIVWSRLFIEGNQLKADLGRGTVIHLPQEEIEARWNATTPQWPIMNAVLHGVSRDQFMGRHKANHIQVAYGRDARSANQALFAKAVAFREMGIQVNICGDIPDSSYSTIGEVETAARN